MRKLAAIGLVALSLGGCASLQTAGQIATIATKTIDNPVTEQELFQIEASLRIVTEGLVTYRRQCLAGTVDKNCRANIEAIQPYSRKVPALLTQLRAFVRTQDKVNAWIVYQQLGNLYTTITTTAAQRGVSLGAAS